MCVEVQQPHHAAVAPVAAGVEEAHASPGGIGQEPHLGGQGVHALPGVAAQHGQPQLGPGGGHHCPSLPQDLRTIALADGCTSGLDQLVVCCQPNFVSQAGWQYTTSSPLA